MGIDRADARIAMLEQEVEECKRNVSMMRSGFIANLLDIKVFVEEGDEQGALDYINELMSADSRCRLERPCYAR